MAPIGRTTLTAPHLLFPVNAESSLQSQQVQKAESYIIYTKKEVAELLWLNPEALISDDMEQKVNAASIHLNENGYKLKGVVADGNCFCNAFLESYRTLSRRIPLLDVAPNPLSFLREQIAGMVEKRDIDRAQVIRKDGEWITAFDEGDLLAKTLKIPIRTITVNN